MLNQEAREEKKELIRVLGECVSTCNHCFSACLKEDDVKKMAECIRLDKECAEVCSFTILMLHRSKFTKKCVELCQMVCEACAEECGKHDAEHCRGVLKNAKNALKNAASLMTCLTSKVYQLKLISRQGFSRQVDEENSLENSNCV